MDFPGVVSPHGPMVGPHTWESIGLAHSMRGDMGGTNTWPTANAALYVPVKFWTPYLVRRVWRANGPTVSGNSDAGLYTLGGARLFSIGSTAQAGADSLQTTTLGTPYLILPGSYYLAMAASNTTGNYYSWQNNTQVARQLGLLYQTSAFPLPATATFAAVSVNGFIPLFGFSNRTANP